MSTVIQLCLFFCGAFLAGSWALLSTLFSNSKRHRW